MIRIEPYDELDDPCCRWNIVEYGVVYEKDLVKELRLYARKLQDEAECNGNRKEVKRCLKKSPILD